MNNLNTMPWGIEKHDSMYGKIIAVNGKGVIIRLDAKEYAREGEVYAFAASQGLVGQDVLVTVLWYHKARNNFRVTIDAVLNRADIQQNGDAESTDLTTTAVA